MAPYEKADILSQELILDENNNANDRKTKAIDHEKSNKYPFKWTPISKEERMARREVYFSHGPWCVSPKASMLDLVRSTPGNVLMPRRFMDIAEDIYNFEVNSF